MPKFRSFISFTFSYPLLILTLLILLVFVYKVYQVKAVSLKLYFLLYFLQSSCWEMFSMPSNVNGLVCILFIIQVLWDKDLHPFQQDTVARERALWFKNWAIVPCTSTAWAFHPWAGVTACSESLTWGYKSSWDILGET